MKKTHLRRRWLAFVTAFVMAVATIPVISVGAATDIGTLNALVIKPSEVSFYAGSAAYAEKEVTVSIAISEEDFFNGSDFSFGLYGTDRELFYLKGATTNSVRTDYLTVSYPSPAALGISSSSDLTQAVLNKLTSNSGLTITLGTATSKSTSGEALVTTTSSALKLETKIKVGYWGSSTLTTHRTAGIDVSVRGTGVYDYIPITVASAPVYVPNGSSGTVPSIVITGTPAPTTGGLPTTPYSTDSISSINSAYPFLAGLLYDLGLFVGVGTGADGKPNFDLNRSANRIESLVLVLRLMGLEKAALAYTGSNPFTDVPDWAARYAAYAYSIGLTVGTDSAHTKFAADREVTQQEFTAFMLRVLGHTEKNGDFVYANAVSMGTTTGLYNANEARLIGGERNFLRGYAVVVMTNALTLTPKGASTQLIDQLVSQGAVASGKASTFKTNLPKVYKH